jgi:hypothetical protein
VTKSLEIRWPDHYQPRYCPVHVRNERDMAAAPKRVWAWLIRATLWPTCYVNSANVKILEGTGLDLQKGTRFRWKTFGVTITSTVLEYVPRERIAWDAQAFGIDAYHACSRPAEGAMCSRKRHSVAGSQDSASYSCPAACIGFISCGLRGSRLKLVPAYLRPHSHSLQRASCDGP